MSYHDDRLRIFTGNAHRELAREIVDYLGIPVGDAEVGRFSNGEIRVIINENVRGTDAFVVQPTCSPVNDTLMELLIMIDALRRASARRITAVIPFYGYARQDRKTRGREPITAKLVANLITVAGADRVLTMDLHAGQIQGFFDIPVDHLSAVAILSQYFRQMNLPNPVVVSPDHGGVARARDMANRLGATIGIIDKGRPEPNVAEIYNIMGDVAGHTAIILDDMIDTGGSVAQAAEALMERGALEVWAACTHPILSGPAVTRLAAAPIRGVVATNTIPVSPSVHLDKLVTLSVAPLLAEAIIRIHEDLSVSTLFN